MRTNSIVAALAASVCVIALATPAQAEQRQFNIPAGSLKGALDAFGRQSGRPIIYRSVEVRRAKSYGYQGSATPEEALQAILAGTGFSFSATSSGAMAIKSGEAEAGSAAATDESADITVTGSRIRGAPIASPVISLSQKEIIESGQTNMGDVVRNIPQNFGGGQNPGSNVNVPGKKSDYIGSGSAIDLRGIGGDATLTLLNGHRLAYNGGLQSIDVSVIPIAALDRLEIVADGSSALYGSDAVAGVANVILKRDYNGLSATARFGASSDGGNQQQEYSAVAGRSWASGGFMLAYDYSHNTPLLSSQRSYTNTTSPGLTLLPRITQNNGIFTGHQDIVENLSFEIDGLYNNRYSSREYALTSAGNPSYYGSNQNFKNQAFSIAPSLKFEAGSNWRVSLNGVYSEDRTFYVNDVAAAGVHSITAGCYCNNIRSVEAAADGSALTLPAGRIKLALGAGYRATGYHGYRTQGAAQNIDVNQNTYYTFGEIDIPIVSPDQHIPFMRKLSLSAAIRYEDYPGVAKVATPKFGIVFSPNSVFDIKASWGRSFKAPTFYERYSSQFASIYNASRLGGAGYASSATVLLLSGGNPDLKPERATTWTVTGTLHPPQIKNLVLEASYFNIQYKNRILAPIVYTTQALIDPADRPYVQYNPSLIDASQALSGRIITNYTGATYNPASVVAIVQNSNLNAASQSIHGVDMSAAYRFAIGKAGELTIRGDGSYLDSDQRVSAIGPVTQLAGTIYNPAHFRGRGGITWSQYSLTVATFANYVGAISDVRTGLIGRSRSMTTIDLSARYAFRNPSGAMKGVAISASALNLFNRAPGTLKTAGVYDTPYDPLNYAPVGRFLTLTVSKDW